MNMRENDVSFVRKMREHMAEGMNFAEVAQETVAESMGGSPSEVLFKMIGKEGVMRPELFVERIESILGEGVTAILSLIEERAGRWRELTSIESPSASPFESIMQNLIQMHEVRSGNSVTVLLHDHRIKDQLDTYAEDF
jgi:hypothetical protein